MLAQVHRTTAAVAEDDDIDPALACSIQASMAGVQESCTLRMRSCLHVQKYSQDGFLGVF